MKRRTTMCWIIVILMIVSMMAAGCASPAPENPEGTTEGEPVSELREEKVLVMGYERDAETLDHIKTAWYSDALIYMFDRLVTRDYDFNYRPGLASSWDVSEDGLTWTFHLLDGVTFHNGEPLTATDVKWTFDTILDPDTASPFAGDLGAIEEINIIDDLTIDFVLKYPFPNLLFNLSNTAAGIAWHGIYDEYGDDYGALYVVGTGPYIFDEWVRGDKIVLVKNEDYNWGPEWMSNRGPSLIDKVVLRTIPEENSRLMELDTGGIHILRNISPATYEQIKDKNNIEVVRFAATRLGYLAYATDKEPFTDVRVRRAINHAVDRESIAQFVFRGLAVAAYGYLPPALTSEYYADSQRDGYEYDLDKAKSLLTEAGYENGLTMELSADNSSESTRLAEVLQAQLGEAGIDVQIRLFDSASYTDYLREGNQELFIRLYSWPNADILDWFLLSSQAPFPNHSRWIDETTDELITSAAQMPTWDERSAGYHEVQKHLIEQAVWCPIYVPETLIAVREEVTGFKFHPWMIQINDGFDLE